MMEKNKRAFSLSFFLAIFLIPLTSLFDVEAGFWRMLMGQTEAAGGDVVYLLHYGLRWGVYGEFSLIYVTFPYAYRFSQEWNSGMTPYLVHRMGVKRYTWMHVGMSALSGGLAYVAGRGIFILILRRYYPLCSVDFYDTYILSGIGQFLEKGMPTFYILGLMLLTFFNGCLWSAVTSVVSTIITNPYVVVIIPYFLNRIYIECAKVLKIQDAFRIDYLFASKGDLPYTPAQTIIIAAVVTGIVVCLGWVLFQYELRRRIANEK
ncbi:MAG: hypothetical protein ACI4EH_02850 [Oliverpabstia sp.]